MIYDVNFKDFVADYLPPDKRQERQIAYLTALLKPLDTLHVSTFGPFRSAVISDAKENGQKIILEDVLNKHFGVVSAPFIYIDNSGDDVAPVTFFQEEEFLTPVYLFQDTEVNPVDFYVDTEVNNNKQFKVFVPVAVYAANGEDKIRAQVDRLRPYSTFYSIIQY